MIFRSREILGLVFLVGTFSAEIFGQLPPIEDQHFFGPGQFKSGPNDEVSIGSALRP